MSPVNHIGCPACGMRIKEFEPDICLKKLDGSGEMYFYHTRCRYETERVASEGEEKWSLTHRSVFWDEGGAA